MGGIILRNRLLGELAVSRSFGDSKYKPYVLSDPEIIEHKLNGDDEFLIMGTDGFWNVLGIDKTAEFIRNWKKTRTTSNINRLS